MFWFSLRTAIKYALLTPILSQLYFLHLLINSPPFAKSYFY